jgi:hypothetical protein
MDFAKSWDACISLLKLGEKRILEENCWKNIFRGKQKKVFFP